MPAFDFMPLLWWGLPLAAAPLLIHLINLLRHRQVKWAAMEFLLASQRKYRTRVLLRQLLLLLSPRLSALLPKDSLNPPPVRRALAALGKKRLPKLVLRSWKKKQRTSVKLRGL